MSAPPVPLGFCITDLDAGGAERVLVRLVMGLDRQQWTPSVYCLGPPGALVAELERAEIKTVCLGARSARDLGVFSRLTRALRADRPRLLQTFLFHANLAGRIAAKRAGIRHVVSGIRVAERRARWHRWFDRWTDPLVERHVCVSEGVAEFSVRVTGLPRRKIVVIPNGVDADRFARAAPADLTSFGIPADSPVLLTIGRLDQQKGVLPLLAAFAQVRLAQPDLHLVWVGEGPLRSDAEQWIAAHNAQGRVHLIGRREDIPELLQRATQFVSASLWEGMSNAVLEALAAGVPLIATRIEGTTELVRDGETGRLVSSNDADGLAIAIQRTLMDLPRAKALARAGAAEVRARYTWERMILQYEELYRSLLGLSR